MAWRRYENQQDRHEFPAGAPHAYEDTGFVTTHFITEDSPSTWAAHRPPENAFQALMEAAEGCNPEQSIEDLEDQWQEFQRKLESAGMTARERAVVDHVVFGQRSLSETADLLAVWEAKGTALSKTHIARLRDSGMAKLRKVFLDDLN